MTFSTTPMSLTFKARCKCLFACLLIKLGKLKHDDFTKEELESSLNTSLPHGFNFDIPVGIAKVSLLEGAVNLDESHQTINAQFLASIVIESAGTTLYRAHFIVVLGATPFYDKGTKSVCLQAITFDHITLINDDYALIGDTQSLLSAFLPGNLNTLLGKTVQSALSLVTAGTSAKVQNYLTLFLAGSKQTILDYHTPQIRAAVLKEIAKQPTHFQLRQDVWREALFSRYGERVGIEDNRLRFYF